MSSGDTIGFSAKGAPPDLAAMVSRLGGAVAGW